VFQPAGGKRGSLTFVFCGQEAMGDGYLRLSKKLERNEAHIEHCLKLLGGE
jgi:hypothetical protein